MHAKSRYKIPHFRANPPSVIPCHLNTKNIDNPYYSRLWDTECAPDSVLKVSHSLISQPSQLL